MATGCSSTGLEEQEVAGTTDQAVGQPEQEYDFVEQPDQDLYCPVTFELLLEPHQTECCGQHISERAVDRIIRDGKPCPMCNDDHFRTHRDQYFKRNTINKLKVRCPREKSGCEWVGELGDLKLHLPVCPLQLVECEFAHAGCDVKVPRRDLAQHMTENAQQHLMSATLLNLRLTRELHQKMEEKDRQITELQQQLRGLDDKVEGKIQDLDRKIEHTIAEVQAMGTKITHEITSTLKTLANNSIILQGFSCHEFTLKEFTKCQPHDDSGSWYSAMFTCSINGRVFQMCIHTSGYASAHETHLTAVLCQRHGPKDGKLKWPVQAIAHLQMLNQLGDYNHHMCSTTGNFSAAGNSFLCVGSTDNTYKFYPLDRLGYCADTHTQYLKDDCLMFRLFLKVENV